MKSDYQVIARKFRPQTFKDVIGQEAIVRTLKHAIQNNRLAQGYLFCGSRGTGKTTLARLLAKALNCQQPAPNNEPCNQCSSCREITAGSSLDVLEIDGASHRGIEDIRQINETVGYISIANFKIFIIDEVHMLTKEAFNALLKTLEEPPSKVKFFFATTEPHKVPATILSRCQRFNLNRIPQSQIVSKLHRISRELQVEVDEEALYLLAQRAEGGLRDAESLFDQILAFEDGRITVDSVTITLGLMPREVYFEIDHAGKHGQFIKAFEIADRVFSEGKDLTFFIEGLIEHLRQIMLIKISGIHSAFLTLTDTEKDNYIQSANFYSREQCLDLIEYLLEAQNQLRTTVFAKISLEAILLHVMRSHFRLSIEQLVRHLCDLEQLVNEKNNIPELPSAPNSKPQFSSPSPQTTVLKPLVPSQTPPSSPKVPPPISPSPKLSTSSIQPIPSNHPDPIKTTPVVHASSSNHRNQFVSEDPTPTSTDLGKKSKQTPSPLPSDGAIPNTAPHQDSQPLHLYDTLMHFAAVELEGKLQKKP